MDELEKYLAMSSALPGWITGKDAEELLRVSYELDSDPIIVEIGSFLGRGTILLAGPRALRGSGKVHCIDPFDCSGDTFSVPHYMNILQALGGGTPLEHFQANIQQAGLIDWIEIHKGFAGEVATQWTTPIDLLLLDGDQSPDGAREAYESWIPFLKPGGIIVLRNTQSRIYAEGHDGHRRIVLKEIMPPKYNRVRQIGGTTFAHKAPNANF